MKQLVCDFCDSVRLGAKVGYREFKKAFVEARQVRIYSKQGDYNTTSVMDRPEFAKVKKVRELAQMNFKNETTKPPEMDQTNAKL
jgi:glycine betaine/choline ABC-type transport system substrate-binding protein